MVYIALITSDSRTVSQIQDWLKFFGNEFKLELHSSLKAFIASRVRFFSPIFIPRSEGIIGRCLMSEQIGKGEKAYFACHFMFFGMSDELFHRIRKWIREDYVQGKESA